MTFVQWMLMTYTDDTTICGDLAKYLNENCIGITTNAYEEIVPLLDGLNAPWGARRVFDNCWHRYHEDQFWFDAFLEDCCHLGRSFTEQSGVLYDAYRDYSHQPGKYTHSTTDFYGKLKARDFHRYRTCTGSFVRGLRLKDA